MHARRRPEPRLPRPRARISRISPLPLPCHPQHTCLGHIPVVHTATTTLGTTLLFDVVPFGTRPEHTSTQRQGCTGCHSLIINRQSGWPAPEKIEGGRECPPPTCRPPLLLCCWVRWQGVGAPVLARPLCIRLLGLCARVSGVAVVAAVGRVRARLGPTLRLQRRPVIKLRQPVRLRRPLQSFTPHRLHTQRVIAQAYLAPLCRSNSSGKKLTARRLILRSRSAKRAQPAGPQTINGLPSMNSSPGHA